MTLVTLNGWTGIDFHLITEHPMWALHAFFIPDFVISLNEAGCLPALDYLRSHCCRTLDRA